MTRAQNQPWFDAAPAPRARGVLQAPSLDSARLVLPRLDHRADEIEWKRKLPALVRGPCASSPSAAARSASARTPASSIVMLRLRPGAASSSLQQEAGFHPLDVRQARDGQQRAASSARRTTLGRIKAGFKSGSGPGQRQPAGELQAALPDRDGRAMRTASSRLGGTVEWTIKDGYCYRGSILMDEVRADRARGARGEVGRALTRPACTIRRSSALSPRPRRPSTVAPGRLPGNASGRFPPRSAA